MTESKNDEVYPLEAYQLKGDYFYREKNYKKALDNYLKVSFYANKYKNEIQIFDSNYNIGILKRKIGEKEEALKLYKENFLYAKKKSSKVSEESYLNSITVIANIFNDMNLPDSSSFYNKLGLIESNRLKNKYYAHHFSLNEGVSFYYKKKYQIAIDSLEKHIPYFEKIKQKTNLSYAYYYCGESYLKLGVIKKAIHYFKKTDTIFREKQNINTISRKSYEHLIHYYKQNKNTQQQLTYINQLMKVDSILHAEALYLNKKIFKEYDIPKLNAEKAQILKTMENNKVKFQKIILFTSITLLITLLFLIYQYRKRKIDKKRFEEILNSDNNTNTNANTNTNINIPKEIINNVLNRLTSFEKKQLFISKKTTLNSLAKDLNTNTNYLSKIINHYKNNTFSNYLNSLRIAYITDRLKTDVTLRRFTIKAIAQETGFNNSESFSKAFYKINGIKPSYFLRELDKLNKDN